MMKGVITIMAYAKKGKKFSNNKSRTSNSRAINKSEEPKDARKEIHSYNDASWYTVAGQLTKDVGSLSFNNALGMPLTINSQDGSATSLPALPGIATLHMAPAVGVATSEVAGVNVAAQNLLSWLVHWNSRNTKYNKADMMMYYIAMDQVYSFLAHLIRVYGVARVFSQTNRYVGKAILQAMEIDPDSIYSNLANLRAYINTSITKAGTMCVPANMTYFLRHIWMYTNVYKDEDIAKANMYMYVPSYFWQLSVEGSTSLKPLWVTDYFNTTDGVIAPVHAGGSYLTFATLKSKFDSMLNAILANEDMNLISGDVLKAYGREGLFGLSLINEDYATYPVYSEEVLTQIHNTNFVGTHPVNAAYQASIDSLSLIQDLNIGPNNMLFKPLFKDCSGLPYDKILDFYKEDPSPEDVITASRNIVFTTGAVDPSTSVYFGAVQSCGSELPLYMDIFWLNTTGNLSGDQAFANSLYPTGTRTRSNADKFNYFPTGYLVSTTTGIPLYIGGDTGNYTVLDGNTAAKLHDTAILSLFGVPTLGNATRG